VGAFGLSALVCPCSAGSLSLGGAGCRASPAKAKLTRSTDVKKKRRAASACPWSRAATIMRRCCLLPRGAPRARPIGVSRADEEGWSRVQSCASLLPAHAPCAAGQAASPRGPPAPLLRIIVADSHSDQAFHRCATAVRRYRHGATHLKLA
jgi:hypothetical protein